MASNTGYGAVAPYGGYGYPFGGFGAYPGSFGGFGGFGGFGSNWLAPSFPGSYGAVTPFGGNFGAPFGGNFNRMFRDLEKTFNSELNLHPSRPASYLEHYSLVNPIRFDADGNRWLNCYFDLRSYKPEEVSVTLDTKNRFLNVEATHEVKDKEHYIKRNYSRKVYIPEDLKIDLSKLELKSALNNEGLLCVEAALPRLSLEEARTVGATGSKSLATTEPNVYKVATKTI